MCKDLSGNIIRTLFVVPSLRRAGGETQVVDLVNSIRSKRIEKHIFAFESELEQLDRLDTNTVHFYHSQRKSKFDYSVVMALSKLIDEKEIDILHCTFQFSLLVAWLARLRSKRKPLLVTALHTTINRNRNEDLLDLTIYRFLLKMCSSVIFVCSNQRDYWLRRQPELKQKSVVIYNGIETEKFKQSKFTDAAIALRQRLNIYDDAIIFSSIAGFRPEKGHKDLLAAFAKLPDSNHLLLAGDGVCRADIEAQIGTLGIGQRVHLLGNLSDVRPVLALSDISVLSSISIETFSIAMLESLAMETPMIASDMGGMSEAIIEGETGCLFKPGDVSELILRMEQMAANKELLQEFGKSGRKLVQEKFTQELMSNETKKLLCNIYDQRCK